ncbi:hypothetical protein AX17_003379 [Amanita inopinata Kibby_2008]|nr:hypothetical protein AX17_003379 [Amanita inopinata Kibby_2008]
MAQDEITLHLTSEQHLVFKLAEESLSIRSTGQKIKVVVPFRQVINASFDAASRILEIAYLARKKDTKKFYLFRYKGSVGAVSDESASRWTESLMHSAYEGAGIKRSRRLRILINPFGGVGKGALVFSRKVEPIFRAAGCSLDVTRTTHNGHAYQLAKEIQADDYDVLVTVSGDGLVHEIMNGFANHSHPRKAFSLPIAPIPTGSGNGLSLNLLGQRDGFDVAAAALNVIKGLPMQVDTFSIVQNDKRKISFMSQALGLMADLDLGTENLRWMGDARFTVGLLRGLLKYKPCPVQLSYKAMEVDKVKMIETFKARRNGPQDDFQLCPTAWHGIDKGFPPLQHSANDDEGWTTFEEPLLYIFAGKGPFVGRDYMAFPISLPDDGLIDIIAMPMTKRSDILQGMSGAASGENFWSPKLHYIKAHAYRIKPLTGKGNLSVDGEAMPFEEFQVEVHAKLATVLSPYGSYAANFKPEPPTGIGP